MPIYTLHNAKTNETYDAEMKFSEYEQLLADNPHITRVWGNPLNIISGVNQKPSDGFREVLRKIKKNNPGSDIDTY